MDCSFYVVDLHYRSLVKLRQESQIPPPIWRGPSRREHPPTHPTDTPLHIQLPQKVTDSYKLVYISHPANSGEHSPADSQGVDFHPGPALRKAHSLEHIDIEARRGPASREHSLVKHSGTKDLLGPAHSLKDNIAHKENPASGGPDSRDCSTAKSSGGIDSSIALSGTHRTAHKSNPASGGPDSRDCSTAHPSSLSNPSDKTEEAYSKGHHPPRHITDHPPTTPPRLTSGAQLEWLDSRSTPNQRKRLRTLKGKGPVKSKDPPPKTPSCSETRENPSPIPPPSEDTNSEPSAEHSEVISLPSSPGSPASPDLTTPRSLSPDRTISPIPTMGTVKDLDIGRHPTIPLPQFRGKKEEDPNDHCMKVEDYFAMFDIESDEDQKEVSRNPV